jgi:hypothetical protein
MPVPNFVPFVPEIVPFCDAGPSYSVMLSCILPASKKHFSTRGFATIDCYQLILNPIRFFWSEAIAFVTDTPPHSA